MIVWRFIHQELLGREDERRNNSGEENAGTFERGMRAKFSVHWHPEKNLIIDPIAFFVTGSPIMEENLQLNIRMCFGSHFELQTH